MTFFQEVLIFKADFGLLQARFEIKSQAYYTPILKGLTVA